MRATDVLALHLAAALEARIAAIEAGKTRYAGIADEMLPHQTRLAVTATNESNVTYAFSYAQAVRSLRNAENQNQEVPALFAQEKGRSNRPTARAL